VNPQQAVLVDPGNPLLAQVDVKLDTGTMWQAGAGGQIGVVTIRTASTTLTLMLTPEHVKTWAKLFTGLAESMSGSGLIVANGGQIGPP
jgi:hypothetical protein